MTGFVATGVTIAVGASRPEGGDPRWRQWLTAEELAYAAGRRRAAEHLAVRRLAKQAVLRLIGWPAAEPWHDLRIRRGASGPPRVVLTGEVAAWCAARGLPTPGVSLSHAAGHAAALAWLPDSGGAR